MNRTPFLVYAVGCIAVSAAARAADPLGLYIGSSVGEADVRSTYTPLTFSGTNVGWKVFFGARPISFAGFEVAYTDFGHATAPVPPPTFDLAYLSDSSRQQAATIFGVGYLPLPVPFLDVYGKVGVARLDTRIQVEVGTDPLPGRFNFLQNQWSTDVAYGAGVQARYGQFALRAEYERINAIGGAPTFSSAGVLWRF
jgi:hypothetical protein